MGRCNKNSQKGEKNSQKGLEEIIRKARGLMEKWILAAILKRQTQGKGNVLSRKARRQEWISCEQRAGLRVCTEFFHT